MSQTEVYTKVSQSKRECSRATWPGDKARHHQLPLIIFNPQQQLYRKVMLYPVNDAGRIKRFILSTPII